MKKLLLIAALLTASVATYGQGQLVFANASAQKITNNVTGNAVPQGTSVGLYVGNIGDPAGSLTLAATTPTTGLPPGLGLFVGGTVTLPGRAGGTTVAWQLRAWLASTVYPSYEAAVAAGLGGDTSVVVGVSGLHTITLAESPTPLPTLVGNGLEAVRLSPVPEPSSIALGLLGLGAVALFRRRK